MSYEYIQKPCLNVKRSLEQWGGWHKSFARSLETRNAEDTLASERDPRFWELFAATREEEQLREEVEVCLREYRTTYVDRRKNDALRIEFRKALLATGWKPNNSLIKREIRALKKERREEISWLKESITRKRPRTTTTNR